MGVDARREGGVGVEDEATGAEERAGRATVAVGGAETDLVGAVGSFSVHALGRMTTWIG